MQRREIFNVKHLLSFMIGVYRRRFFVIACA